jgi:hypothetical protein
MRSFAEAFPGLTESEFAALGFTWLATFGAYRRCFGDYWLMCYPAAEFGSNAIAALILDEYCLFEVELRTLPDLADATKRTLAFIAEREEQTLAESFQALLERHNLGQLFSGNV